MTDLDGQREPFIIKLRKDSATEWHDHRVDVITIVSGMRKTALPTLVTPTTTKLKLAPGRLVDTLKHLKLAVLFPGVAPTLPCEHIEMPCPKLLITMLGADRAVTQREIRIIDCVGRTTLRIS